MPDSRYHSAHLEAPRRELFRRHREAAYRSCGSRTNLLHTSDPELPAGSIVLMDPSSGHAGDTGYMTVAGSVIHHLQVGCNVVGRHRNNEIVIADQAMYISRQHCAIVVHADGTAEIHDLASLNGTFVNGRRLQGSAPLHSNDTVRLGAYLSFNVILYTPPGN